MKSHAVNHGIAATTIFLLSIIPTSLEAGNDVVAHEVERLIAFIKPSNCTFKRNGSWFEAVEAADHISKKYRYITKKGMVQTTEDFIKYAATKSSISGKAYIVKCNDKEPQKSGIWLNTALAQIRDDKK